MVALLLGVAGSATAAERDIVTALFTHYGGQGAPPIEAALGIGFDPRRSEILVANTRQHRIDFYDTTGRARGGFIHRVPGPDGTLIDGNPRAVALDAAGRLLVADVYDPCVDVLDFFGRSIRRLCLPDDSEVPAADRMPGTIALAPDSTIWVATSGDRGRIYRFDPAGSPLGAWGTPGRAPGELSRITGVGFLPDGQIVVTCSGTELAVQRFTRGGRYVSGFGRHEIGPGNFSYPSALAITSDGRIWVSDAMRQMVQVFDAQGRLLAAFGSAGTRGGEFLFPSGLATDGQRFLAVSERVGRRFQLFRIEPEPPQGSTDPEGGEDR